MIRDTVPERAAVAGTRGEEAVSPTVLDAVAALRAEVAKVRFPLALPGAAQAEEERQRVLDQLDGHLLPRLRALSAPGVVVVAGSTGAGKSTIVNTLLGEEVSPAGVLRPTTRRPVLVHHPADTDLLAAHPLRGVVDVIEREAAPRGLAIVDAPDLDSVETANRDLAHRLLETADLWLFVTTATRYGDALPWQVLDRAAARGTSMAMVLNRVPGAALREIRQDLMARLHARGMVSVPLFLLADRGPHEGPLESAAVAPIRRWLATVAGPDRARSVIARTQRGALAAVGPWVHALADAVDEQGAAAAALARVVDRASADSALRVAERVGSGEVADGAVRGRWSQVTAALTSRRAPARAEAVAALRADLLAATTAALVDAREAGGDAVAAALATSGLPGAEDLIDLLATPWSQGDPAGVASEVPTPEESAAAWLDGAGSVLRLLEGGPSARTAARLGKRLGEDGVGLVVAAAAAGLGAAGALLTQAAGRAAAHEIVVAGAGELARRAGDQAAAAARPVRDALASPHLASGAGVGLSLRLAALEGLR